MNSRLSRRIVKSAVFFSILCLTGPLSQGQANLGAISGTVTDPSKAVLAGANVTITNEATNDTRTVQTDSRGFYDVESLEPGSYTVTISATGFKQAVYEEGDACTWRAARQQPRARRLEILRRK